MTPSSTPPTSSPAADDFVIQLAIDHGMLHPAQIDAARAIAANHGDATAPTPRVLELLVQQGVITSRQIAEMLAAEFGLQMAPDFTNVRILGDVLEMVPRAIAAKHRLL